MGFLKGYCCSALTLSRSVVTLSNSVVTLTHSALTLQDMAGLGWSRMDF